MSRLAHLVFALAACSAAPASAQQLLGVSEHDFIGEWDEVTGAYLDVWADPVDSVQGLARGPDGNIYVSRFKIGAEEVLRYDPTGAFIDTFVPDEPESHHFRDLAFGPDGDLYVARSGSRDVGRYDGVTGAPLGVFGDTAILAGPNYMGFGPDGDLYANDEDAYSNGFIRRFDGATGEDLGPFAADPFGVDIGLADFDWGGNGDLYWILEAEVGRFDGATGAYVGSVALSLPGEGIQARCDGTLWVSAQDGTIYLIDESPSVVGTYTSDSAFYVRDMVPPDDDLDGVQDLCDQCVGDDAWGDTDADGLCEDLDVCAGEDLTGDADADLVCNDIDACLGDDSSGDTDGDGVCDDLDSDSDGDGCADPLDADPLVDNGDTDGDGVTDDCDPCPIDDPDDSDLDGTCDSAEVCPGFDDDDDFDDDGTPDGCDGCPADPSGIEDSDGDGVCDVSDLCTGNDVFGDADLDGVCGDLDLCVGDDATGDTDGDGVCDSDEGPADELTLSHNGFVAGGPTTLTATGAEPGESVIFLRGPGLGAGPCPAPLGGVCLDIAVTGRLGSAVADVHGTAILTFVVPGSTMGLDMAVQAVVERGPDSMASNAEVDTVF